MKQRISPREKIALPGNMLASLVLVILVFGFIITGITTPVKSAGMVTFAALVVAAMQRRLKLENLHSTAISQFRLTGMVFWRPLQMRGMVIK